MNRLNKCEKSIFIIALCIMLIVLGMAFTPKIVKAEEIVLDDSQIIEQGYGVYKISDEKLYNALWDKCQALDPSAQHLTIGTFKDLQTLDLSNKSISSIYELKYFNLNSLITLDISNNQITSKIEDFSNMPNLQTLNATNNKISYFDAKNFTNLVNLDLSNNQLTFADISSLTEGGMADLTNNMLADFSKLIFPTTNSEIFLTHNLLTGQVPQTTCTLYMGFQGVKPNANLTKNSSIVFYGLEGVENVKIYKVTDQETLVATLNIEGTTTNLAIGNYVVKFTENNDPKLYADLTFTLRPLKPTVLVTNTDGDKATEPYILSYETIVQITTEEDNGEIFYSINNGTAVKGNRLDIKSGGSYTIKCWQVIDGMESESVTVLVICKISNPLMLVWLLLGVLAIATLFYAFYYLSKNLGKKKSNNSNKGFK